MEGHSADVSPPMEGQPLPREFWTFDMVQERLVEAMITCWRHPDRERGWQRVRSAWPDILREVSAGDYDARGADLASSDVEIRPASLTRIEVGEMEEAFGWTDMLALDDRKLVGMVVTELAKGQREVKWRRLLVRMGLQRGAEGLRKRYGRAINAICVAKNGGNALG